MAKRLQAEYFEILNKDGKPVLYRTSDATLNVFTFTFTNKSDADITLIGGTPVNPPAVAAWEEAIWKIDEGDGSTFNVNFESMLTATVVENMKLTLPDKWASQFYPGEGSKPPSWSVAPEEDVILTPGQSIAFTLANITCETTQPGNFEIMYAHVKDYADSNYPITKHLAVENPIDPGKKTLPLEKGFIDPIHPIQGQTEIPDTEMIKIETDESTAVPIYITYNSKALIENGFTYFLTNTSKDPLVPTQSFDPENPPVLYLSFLFGDQYYDVTSQDLGDNNIAMAVASDEGSEWTPKQHTARTAYWQFNPKNPQVLKGKETVKFEIKRIITQLNVDPGKISVMYIQFNNVPGYNDANFTLALHKKRAEAAITKLTVNPKEIQFGENVVLKWVTELAWRVTLEYHDRDDQKIVFDSEKGQIRLNENAFPPNPAPTAQDTRFTLTAYDSDDFDQDEVSVKVAQPPAVIEFFKSDPMLADVSKPAPITLSWKINNARSAEIETPEKREPVDRKAGTFPYNLQSTTVFTLFAYGYGSPAPPPVSLKVRVYAYKPGTPLGIPFTGDAMQTWPSILINNPKGRVYAVDGGNKTVYNYAVATGVLDATYPGTVIALSKDGSKLFVFNPDNAKFGVVMIDTSTNAISAPCGFGPVYQMLVTPDLTRLYCAGTKNVNTVTRLNINPPANTLSVQATITVGMSPRAMVFNNDISKLYVANYDSKSVSVIRVADNVVIKAIDLPSTEPHSFAYHAALNKLYVACEGSDLVVVIDTTADTVKTQIQVGNRPSSILLSPNGQFAYVANFGGNTVSVIDTATDTVKTTLTVGTGPIAMALNGDANVFFVGNYCSRTLSVVDVNNNLVLPQALSTGDTNGNPFDLAAYTESNDYTRIYVAKEAFKPRIDCATTNNGLAVSVFSVQKPGR